MSKNKSLLIEYIPFNTSKLRLIEGVSSVTGNKVFYAEGVMQRAEAKNQNGRCYPREVLLREAKKYSGSEIAERRAYGELDHPDSPVVNLKNASHTVEKLWWNGDDLLGRIELLNTPTGNIAKAILKAGKTLGISSRGLGSVEEMNEGGVMVQGDFELIAFDLVSNPSTHGAFMESLNENIDPKNQLQAKKYFYVNRIITDILRGE